MGYAIIASTVVNRRLWRLRCGKIVGIMCCGQLLRHFIGSGALYLVGWVGWADPPLGCFPGFRLSERDAGPTDLISVRKVVTTHDKSGMLPDLHVLMYQWDRMTQIP